MTTLSALLVIILILILSASNLAKVINITITDKLTVWLYASNIARITTLPDEIIEKPSATSRVVTYIPSESVSYMILNPDSSTTIIKTSDIQIKCNNHTNKCTFYDIIDVDMKSAILSEYNKTFTTVIDTATNNKTYKILQEWMISNSTKAIYGWGQYQNGFLNYIGSTIRCVQFNTEACIPMIITNSFYGIYWDNYGVSTLNSIKTEIKTKNITTNRDINDMPNGTHCIWYNLTAPFIASNINGNRYFYSYFNNWTTFGASLLNWEGWMQYGYIEFYIERQEKNTTELVDIFNYSYNIPGTLAMKPFYMNANEKINIILKYKCFNYEPIIYYREPQHFIDIESNEAFYIDYYFIYAPPNKYQSQSPVKQTSLDGIIKGYRLLTQHAPLYELSNYGFWQSQNRYHTQNELILNAITYREKQLPVDVIVQDWRYWGSDTNWGPQWDYNTYPNPKSMLQELHNMSFYFMISVESQFGSNSTCLKFIESEEEKTNNIEIIKRTVNTSKEWIDPYNKQAQMDYYECIKNTMFDIGVDAIWSDATEPQPFVQYNELLDNNKYSGNALFNTFSLQIVESIQEGLNNDFPHKRVFDLARSTFAGQSKTGGCVWSGDSTSNYDQLRRQIVASLSTQCSGNPYWSQDIGGFFRPSCNYYCWWYKQLLIRWFQFGAFVPIFRVHGNNVNTSYWNYGPIVLQNVYLIDNLRYRLLPYIYSNAYYIANYGYTLQRSLIFDFYDDINIYNISHQFMFGPYILVSPVFNYDNTTNIYLPSKYNLWYDFWTGNIIKGGTFIKNIIIPLSQIPLHIHDGSILIMAPFSQWTNQYYPWNELEIRIYTGSDAQFIYFNDDGKDRLSLQNNLYITILFEWIDNKKQLNIGERKGNYTEMIDSIKLNIVIVSQQHGVGVNITQIPDKTVIYTGSALIVNF